MQSNFVKASIDSIAVQPTITNYGAKATLNELNVKLKELQALTYTLKDCPGLMDTLQSSQKDLTTLWERYHLDNPDDGMSSSKKVKPSLTSMFDRLPRIELPSFNGDSGSWCPYWEKFKNALEKDPNLSNVDQLSFFANDY